MINIEQVNNNLESISKLNFSLESINNLTISLENIEHVLVMNKPFLNVRAGSEDYYAGNEFILAGNDGDFNLQTYPITRLQNIEVLNG
ncbi:hypothetical protein GW932_02960 [archaeon]|nr:hypothetical protein [archaeon]